ncbi:hypothetical protein LEM8419_03407 [Neolewinella maritima]|uniref:Uncharacterized protein n=1 Tax=Neolewinella maritima TaxID=1383882 RepID=A0ABN8FEW6_9BACT|nr:hypothetical protein LEM8419_03407 [Neolewinella maritima]
MFSGVSWGQFLTFAVPLLVGYGVVVIYLFYRDRVSRSATSSGLVGKPARDGYPSQDFASVVGKTLEQKAGKNNSVASPAPSPFTCKACGHVHGTPAPAPRLNSYGLPITNHAAPPIAPATPLTEDFDLVDGSVDLASMFTNLAKVSSGMTTVASGTPTNEVISEKAEALSLFANEDLINSEFTSLLASELDKAAPTFGYCAADSLEDLKTAA